MERLRRRRTGTSAATVSALSTAVVVLALTNPGYLTADLQLHDSGVWVTRSVDMMVGRFNHQAQTVDAYLPGGSPDVDVLQREDLVLITDPAGGTVTLVDVATVGPAGSSALPDGAVAELGGRTLAVWSPQGGPLWVLPATELTGFSEDESAVAVELGEGGDVAVGVDGTVVAADPATGTLTTVTVDDDGRMVEAVQEALDVASDATVAVTMVGRTAVVLDRDAGALVQPRAIGVQGAGSAVLQDPSTDADDVALATEGGLVLQPLDGSDAQTEAASGEPTVPVRVGGCVYGAWSDGDVVRECDGDADDLAMQLTGNASGGLRYRVNRGVVVLNQLADGTVWLADQEFEQLDVWQDVLAERNHDSEEEDDSAVDSQQVLAERELTNRPPVAGDDDLGVRPGRTTILTVQDNDSDPDGDILRATPDGETTFGPVQQVLNGAALQVSVPADATGTATFEYTLDDGREGGIDTGRVSLTVRASGENGLPAPLRETVATVEQGSSVSIDVLTNWRDPDGDVLQLVGAEATAEGDSVRFTADGTMTFTDGGTERTRKQVTVWISDGVGDRVEGTVLVDVVAADVNLPPVAVVDHVRAVVGREVTIEPLANDTDPNGDPLRLVRVDDVAGLTLGRNLDAGQVTVTGQVPGTFYLLYQVTDGPTAPLGLIRIDVAEEGTGTEPPVAVRDRALLPTDGSVLVDVLGNDTDPSGGVLVVQSVEVGPNLGLSVAVIEHGVLRVTAGRLGTAPVTFTYTVSNGAVSSQGEVVVVPVTPPAELQSPEAVEDEVTVRAGDVVTVDVLANDTHPNGAELFLAAALVEVPDAAAGLAFVSEGKLRFQAGATAQTVYATYTVRDRQEHKDSAQVTIHVLAADPSVNSAPVPATVTARTIGTQVVRIAIPLDGIDPDGDSIELVGLSRAPVKGRVTALGDGWIEYQAGRNATGTDSFGYTVSDRFGAQAEGVVLVGIAQATTSNQSPVAVDDLRTVRPDREVAIAVLANDVDPDGDRLALVSSLELGEGIEAEVVVDRVVVQAPREAGTYAIRYQVSDGTSAPATGVLTVTVDPASPFVAPIARDDLLTLADVAGLATVSVDVLENDDDPDGTRDALQVSTSAAGASVAAGGKLMVPVLATAQTLAYTVRDADGGTATAFVRVPGVATQRPVLASTAPLTVVSGETLTLELSELVTVGPERTVRITQAERVLALRGVAGILDEDTLTFVSEAGYYGPAGLTFEVVDTAAVDDPTARRATLSVSIDVTPSGAEPPELLAPEVEAALGEPTTLDLDRFSFDPNDDPLSYSLPEGEPEGLSARVDGSTLEIEPTDGTPVGSRISLPIAVSDGSSEVRSTVTVTVVSSTMALTVATDDVVPDANQGETYRVAVLANDVSPFPGESLGLVSALVESGEGTAVVEGDVVVVTPAPTYVGTLTVRYRVSDSTGDPAREVEGRVLLTVRGVPDAPGTPTVVEVRSHTAVLSWAPPANNGAEILRYDVQVSGEGVVQCPATTCTIEGLTNGRDYTFTVTAVNEVGDSAPSPTSAQIRPDAVPDPPAAPTLTFGDGALTVDWANRDYAGERTPITSVTLEISPPPVAGGMSQVVGLTGTSHTWTGLENGTAYQVRVQAINGAGPSEWGAYSASEIPAGKPDAPGQPQTQMLAAVGSTASTIGVSWAAPVSDHGDAVKTYTLTVLQGGAAVQTIADVTTLSQQVTLPTSETAYTFQVTATNKAGEGPAGPASAPRQSVTPPGAVTSLVARAADRAITVTFGAAPRNGATAAQLRYEYQLNGGGWTALGGTTIGGLVNGTAYSVAVRAVSTVDGASYIGPVTSATYAGPNVTASAVHPYGPLPAVSVSASSGATSVNLAASASGNGCGVTLNFRIDGGSWQTAASSWSGAVGNGYNQTHTIEAYSTDNCSQTSANRSASASSGPPPAPRAWVTRSSSKPPSSSCSDATCGYEILNTQNVPAGTYTVECWDDHGNLWGRSATISVDLPGSGVATTSCYYGYGGENVILKIVGVVDSAAYTWPTSAN